MAENPRPPVAIRIVRPYDNEDEFLENELETVGKTSVILIGAHPRPTGVILRFEMNLQSGATILRGEGRVLAHKESAFRGQPGLTLRFTRLDPKSKALVDRAAAMREARTSGSIPVSAQQPSNQAPSDPQPQPSIQPSTKRSMPPPPANPPVSRPPPDPALADMLMSATPEPPPAPASRARRNAPHTFVAPEQVEAKIEREPTPPPPRDPTPPPPPAPSTIAAPAPIATVPPDTAPEEAQTRTEQPHPGTEPPARASVPAPAPIPTSGSSSGTRTLEPPPDRDALLARLRDRARDLSPEKVRAILDSR